MPQENMGGLLFDREEIYRSRRKWPPTDIHVDETYYLRGSARVVLPYPFPADCSWGCCDYLC